MSLSLALAGAGCKKDDAVVANKQVVENKTVQASIAGVNGPTSGTVSQGLIFSVMWQDTAQYSHFKRIDEVTNGNTTSIKIFASGDSTATIVNSKNENATSYRFKALTAGTYYLKFYKPDNSEKTAIIDTVTIK